nr:MAG TPA: hypothetical protein [Caudoviricetes sp.]
MNQGRRNTTSYNHPYSKYHPATQKPCNRLLSVPLPLFLKHCPYYLYLIKLCQGAGNRPRIISVHVRS